METKGIRQELRKRLDKAQKILVGIGAEWKPETDERKESVQRAARELKSLLKGKDYYVISTLGGGDLDVFPLEKKHMVAPFDVSFTEKQWDAYLRWLSCTLNRELVILELGEDFQNPHVIRWPFERTTLLNQKAYMYRIQEKYYQLPDELKERAQAVAENSVDFLASMSEENDTEEKNGSD